MNARWNAVMLVAALALAGCASGARMSGVWQDPGVQAAPLHDVLVVAVRNDSARRHEWEDAFVTALAARGVKATASYTLFHAVPDSDQILSALDAHHFGGLVASVREAPDRETHVIPGYSRPEMHVQYDASQNRYETWLEEADVPDVVTTKNTQHFRTGVWVNGQDVQLVWSGTLDAPGPLTPGQIDRSVARRIVPALVQAGLVPKATPAPAPASAARP